MADAATIDRIRRILGTTMPGASMPGAAPPEDELSRSISALSMPEQDMSGSARSWDRAKSLAARLGGSVSRGYDAARGGAANAFEWMGEQQQRNRMSMALANQQSQAMLDAVQRGLPLPDFKMEDLSAQVSGGQRPSGGGMAPGYGAAYNDIGVGGPAPSRSIPRNGRPQTIDGTREDDGMGAFLAAAGDGTSSGRPSAFEPERAPATAGPVTPDLAALYRERTADIGKPSDEMNEDQKSKVALDFFLGMLANSSQPGATMLGAAGTAGQGASAEVDRVKERNYQRSATSVNQQREDAYREIGLADKTEDNKSKLKQLGITEAHYNDMGAHMRALEKLEGEKLAITKQYNEGRMQAREYEAQIKEMQANAMLLRASMASMDPLGRSLSTITAYSKEHGLNMSPQEILHFAMSRGKTEDPEATLIDDAWKQATARAASSGMPAPSRDQIVAARKYGSQISRGHPEYQAALRDPTIGGDKKKLDALLQTRGLRVVD